MKTKRAMKSYTCKMCKCTINKGDQYARKTITLGQTTSWAHGDPVPDWAWEPYRVSAPVCEACANPKATLTA